MPLAFERRYAASTSPLGSEGTHWYALRILGGTVTDKQHRELPFFAFVIVRPPFEPGQRALEYQA